MGVVERQGLDPIESCGSRLLEWLTAFSGLRSLGTGVLFSGFPWLLTNEIVQKQM